MTTYLVSYTNFMLAELCDYENLNCKSNATTTNEELDVCVDGIKLIAAINQVF